MTLAEGCTDMNYIGPKDTDPNPVKKRLKLEACSPPASSTIFTMCPTTASKSNASMPLPPPLTFNSTKIKVKQSALVSPVNGIPTVTPYSGTNSPAVQSCQVQPQQRANREPVACKHSTEMLGKLESISRDLMALADLVKDVQKQQTQLTHQLTETKERVLQNSDMIRTCSEHFTTQMSTLVASELDQTEYMKATSTKYEEELRACKEDVSACQTLCRDIVKQNESFTDTLHSIHEAVMQTSQNTAQVANSATPQNPNQPHSVPHLTHDPLPGGHQLPPTAQIVAPAASQLVSPLPTQANIQTNNTGHGIHVQLPSVYPATPTLQHAFNTKPAASTMQLLGDANKYYCIQQGSNGVQQSIQMISVPPHLIQGIQAIQNMQGSSNLLQFVSPSPTQVKPKPNRPTEIRPKQTSTPKKNEIHFHHPPSSCSGHVSGLLSSPKTTNILEEASKVLSNPTIESDDANYLYGGTDSEKDALSEAIMTIPTTYAQHSTMNHSNFSDSLNDSNVTGDDSVVLNTSEMLSKAINVVEGDHNLYFDKVMIGPNGDTAPKPDLQIPSFLPEEVINCVFRKSKEPSIYALNICREILSRDEFINNDFKSFVSKNPLKYKFVEHLLTTKFGLFSDHLQSILKDVRIKFNNYHRHVKRSVRLKEIQKQEQLQMELDRLDREQQRSSDDKMMDLLKQEPTSLDDDNPF